MTIGTRIKNLRKDLGLTQKQLAEKCGYTSLTTINKIELDINNVPTTTIEKIAKALKTTPSYLLGWEENNTKLVEPKIIFTRTSYKNNIIVYDNSGDKYEFTFKKDNLQQVLDVCKALAETKD